MNFSLNLGPIFLKVLLDGLYDPGCFFFLLRGCPHVMKKIWEMTINKWKLFQSQPNAMVGKILRRWKNTDILYQNKWTHLSKTYVKVKVSLRRTWVICCSSAITFTFNFSDQFKYKTNHSRLQLESRIGQESTFMFCW